MAGNNSVNKSFPSSLTMTGTVNICATGTDSPISFGNASNALTFNSGSASSVTGSGSGVITVNSGTNAINVGTDNTTKTITIGNTTGTTTIQNSAITIAANITGASGKTVTFSNSGGNIVADVSTSKILTISTTTGGSITNIGTVASDVPITIGTTNAGNLTITGTSAVNIGNAGAKTISIGSTTGASAFILNAGTAAGGTYTTPSINITGTTANLIPGVLHVVNSGASLCTLTLPTTAAIGTIVSVVGFASGLWTIAQNSGQSINSTASSTTVGITGTLSAVNRYACVQLVCSVNDTTWSVKSFSGTLTYV